MSDCYISPSGQLPGLTVERSLVRLWQEADVLVASTGKAITDTADSEPADLVCESSSLLPFERGPAELPVACPSLQAGAQEQLRQACASNRWKCHCGRDFASHAGLAVHQRWKHAIVQRKRERDMNSIVDCLQDAGIKKRRGEVNKKSTPKQAVGDSLAGSTTDAAMVHEKLLLQAVRSLSVSVRRLESAAELVFLFVADDPIAQELKKAVALWQDHLPSDGPHPWGPQRNLLALVSVEHAVKRFSNSAILTAGKRLWPELEWVLPVAEQLVQRVYTKREMTLMQSLLDFGMTRTCRDGRQLLRVRASQGRLRASELADTAWWGREATTVVESLFAAFVSERQEGTAPKGPLERALEAALKK